MAETPKQRRFCEEYVERRTVSAGKTTVTEIRKY